MLHLEVSHSLTITAHPELWRIVVLALLGSHEEASLEFLKGLGGPNGRKRDPPPQSLKWEVKEDLSE